MPEIDTTHYWRGNGHSFDSQCRLKIFSTPESTVVLLTALLSEDTGQSVTNGASIVATSIAREYSLDPNNTIWIENYPDSEVQFSQVFFDWTSGTANNERWKYLTPQAVRELVQEEL